MPDNRVVADILPGSQECVSIQNPHFRKSSLPDGRDEAQLAARTESKPSLDELNGTLDGHAAIDGEDGEDGE